MEIEEILLFFIPVCGRSVDHRAERYNMSIVNLELVRHSNETIL